MLCIEYVLLKEAAAAAAAQQWDKKMELDFQIDAWFKRCVSFFSLFILYWYTQVQLLSSSGSSLVVSSDSSSKNHKWI